MRLRRTAAIAAAAAATLTAVLGTAGGAQANADAGYIGYGYANNAHAVWCVQKLIDDSPAPAYTATDGVFGPDTYTAIRTFQQWMVKKGFNPGGVDGVVGPLTGDGLLELFNDYYDNYCDTYLPTT